MDVAVPVDCMIAVAEVPSAGMAQAEARRTGKSQMERAAAHRIMVA
jgi:hypothetical protein